MSINYMINEVNRISLMTRRPVTETEFKIKNNEYVVGVNTPLNMKIARDLVDKTKNLLNDNKVIKGQSIDIEYPVDVKDSANITKAKQLIIKTKKMFDDKRFKFAIKIVSGLIIISIVGPSLTTFAGEVGDLAVSAEMQQVENFIGFVISIIRVLAISVCGLKAALTGIKILTEENIDGPKETKKTAQIILWALFLVYAGTGIASLLARKLLGGL